jgi:large repetitive protein
VSTPPGTGTVPVLLTTSGGTATAPEQFTYLQAPVIIDVSPSSGPTSGGTTVEIVGGNLGGALSVKFGSASATILSSSAGAITVESPPGTGVVDVSVTTFGGTTTAKAAFMYYSCADTGAACPDINQLTISCAPPTTPPTTPPTAPTATCSPVEFPGVTIDGSDQVTTAPADSVYITDNRGDPTVGWSVTAYMVPTAGNANAFCAGLDDFCDESQGASVAGAEGQNGQLPASDLSIGSLTCTPGSGNANPPPITGTHGAFPDGPGALTLCSALPTQGGGTFVLKSQFTLRIPASAYAGTYKGTVEYLVT